MDWAGTIIGPEISVPSAKVCLVWCEMACGFLHTKVYMPTYLHTVLRTRLEAFHCVENRESRIMIFVLKKS